MRRVARRPRSTTVAGTRGDTSAAVVDDGVPDGALVPKVETDDEDGGVEEDGVAEDGGFIRIVTTTGARLPAESRDRADVPWGDDPVEEGDEGDGDAEDDAEDDGADEDEARWG